MLDEQERRLLLLLPGPILAADHRGAILYANQPACKVLGYKDPKELVGRSIISLMPPRFVQRHIQGFERYLQTGQSGLLGKRIRASALTRTGEERPIELHVRMFRRPDGSDLIIGAFSPADAKEHYVEFSVSRLEEELVDRDYSPA